MKNKRTRIASRRLIVQTLEGRRLLAAGPYAPAAGQPDSTAISNSDPALIGWATVVADYSPGSNVDEVWKNAANALGPAEGSFDSIVSLGRGGSLTLSFDAPIRDGLGADFAVFENSINDTFLELGFVEVSSDGVNYFRFDSDSKTPSAVASFGVVDPTNIHNLAGKYRGGFGTPFDLAELRGHAGLDVTSVQYVRLVDIVGDGSTTDASGDPIYDPTPTFQSAGLDIDGVGVIHAVETGEAVIDFETLGQGIGADKFDNGVDASGEFIEDELSLNNNYYSSPFYESWSGWSISQTTDTTTAGYANQFSNITGSGVDDSQTFAVGFVDTSPTDPLPLPAITIDPASGSRFDSLYVTNTTYAVMSMRDGDGFAKKFGGVSGDDPDFLQLTITGVDAAGNSVGDVIVMLADFRPSDHSQDFILDAWSAVDVSSLAEASSLQFSLESTDNSPYGMNTPAYFAVDSVTLRRAAVPLDLGKPRTSESGSVIARVSRPTLDSRTDMIVLLERTGSDQATLPASITIPAGAAFAEFDITPVDDAVPTADRSVQITASSDLLLPTTRSLLIEDDDVLAIYFTPSVVNATEGDGPRGATLTLARNDADVSSPLTVMLTHDATALLTIPATATFAASQRTITIPIDVLDDDLASAGQTIAVQATAVGRTPAQLTIALADDDLAALRIDPTLIRLSEDDIATTRTVTLYRNTADSTGAVTVSLSLPEGGPLTIPTEVTIPAGESSVTFDVEVVDDALVNALAIYSISATHANLLKASLGVEVTDNDGPPPSLAVSAPETGLSESDAVFVSDFESLGAGLLSGEFDNDAGVAGAFDDGTLQFENSFDNSFGFDVWSGFAISRGTDSQTPEFTNQYSAIAGGGADGSSTYAVAYAGSPVAIGRVSGMAGFATIDVTNTTYAGLSMRDGDDFAKKFGGESGTDPDFLLLTISGLDGDGNSLGEVEVYLADYRFENSDLDYILEDWSTIDVSSIGSAETLSMRLTSSDNGSFGMNTPAYFAIDNVLLQPESAALPMITITRTGGDQGEALEVSLSDDRSELRIPALVTIPAGASQVSVPVMWLNNSVAAGDRVWQVDASAAGFTAATQNISLLDDDVNQLSITPSANEVSESVGQLTIGFEDIGETLALDSYHQGTDGRGGFESGSLQFPTAYNSTYGSWSGWAASNVTDVVTAGYTNQFSAYANLDGAQPGGGADDSSTFAVAGGYGSSPLSISLPDGFDGASFASIDITNTTYAALSMLQGDDFAKQFGGEAGADPDYFLLTIDGIDGSGATIDSIDFYLADFRFDDNSLDYIVDDWTSIDLSTLAGAASLQFSLSSSDAGDFGMNTPAYFAIDNLVIDRSTGATPSLVISRNSSDLSDELIVTLVAAPTQPFSTPPSVVIPAGVDRVRVPLNVLDDSFFAGDQTVEFTVTSAGFADATGSVTVLDDELPSLVLTNADENIELVEGGPAQSFAVRLPSPPSGPVTISITGGEGSLDVSATELTFGPEDWDQPQTITVAGRSDLLAEAAQVIRLYLTSPSDDYASASVWIRLADYQPEQLTLQRVENTVELVDDTRDLVFGQYLDDEAINIAFSNQAQRFTFEPVVRADANVNLGGGDDILLLHSSLFTLISGGDGHDNAVLAPLDLGVGESIDVADWLINRVISFEDVVLGAATVGADTASIPFTLDAEKMQTLFGSDAPLVRTAVDQNWSLVGDWQIGQPSIEDGEFTGRIVSGAAEVWVATNRPYQNFVQHGDVDGNGDVTSVDALAIINRLNANPEFVLPSPNAAADFAGYYYDVSGDGLVTSLDALQVINWLNDYEVVGDSDTELVPADGANGENLNSLDNGNRRGREDAQPIGRNQTQTEAIREISSFSAVSRARPSIAQVTPMGSIKPDAVDAAIGEFELFSTLSRTLLTEPTR